MDLCKTTPRQMVLLLYYIKGAQVNLCAYFLISDPRKCHRNAIARANIMIQCLLSARMSLEIASAHTGDKIPSRQNFFYHLCNEHLKRE